MMVMESAHDALTNFTRLLKNGKSSNDCMFSNLGRIQIAHEYKNFTLENVFSPSVIGHAGKYNNNGCLNFPWRNGFFIHGKRRIFASFGCLGDS
ncbi:hypothetical protein [Chryseobacterium wanjuense]